VLKLDDALYGRVYGAIGWPGSLPGAAVVVGEEYSYEPGTYTRHMHVFTAYRNYDLSEIFRNCVDLTGSFKVDRWFARIDPAMIRVLWQFNKEGRKERTGTLQLSHAPHSDSGHIAYHMSVLKKTMKAESQCLHGVGLKGINVLNVKPEEVAVIHDIDAPDVAALAYAVTAMKNIKAQRHKEHVAQVQRGQEGISATTGY